MAKRYHQSKKHEGKESRAMERREHRGGRSEAHEVPHHSPVPNVVHGAYSMRDREQYAGHEQSRRDMARDGMLIAEDRHATALLPTHIIDRDWPRAHYYDMGTMADLFSGVQQGMKEDSDDMRRTFKPGKY